MSESMPEPIPTEECVSFDEGGCSGPVELRPGIRLTNVKFPYWERHW